MAERVGVEQVRAFALEALEEYAAAAGKGPLRKTRALRFLLAWLALHARERWPFDAFWREATAPPHDATEAAVFGRHQSLTNAVNGIYVQLGVERRR